MEEYFDNKSIFLLINKWRLQILIITVITAIVSGLATYLVTPLYKSTAVLYPVNLATFSDENETEQMLQFLQSNDIKFKLIENLKLDKHYQIDKNDKLFNSYMFHELRKKIILNKTEYESVRIIVFDKDPNMAVNIINEIIKLYNKKVQAIHKYKYKELLDIKAKEMRNKSNEIDSLEKRINYLRNEYGLLDYKNQVKELTRNYFRLSSTKSDKAQEAKILLDNFEKYGGEYKALDLTILNEIENLNVLKQEYEKVSSEYHKDITYANIIEEPFAADEISKPIRWVIILLSVVGVLILFIIVMAIVENIKTQKK